MAVALPSPGGSKLPVASLQVLGRLFFENFLQHGLHAFAHPASTSRFTSCSNLRIRVKCLPHHSTHNLPDAIRREGTPRSSGKPLSTTFVISPPVMAVQPTAFTPADRITGGRRVLVTGRETLWASMAKVPSHRPGALGSRVMGRFFDEQIRGFVAHEEWRRATKPF